MTIWSAEIKELERLYESLKNQFPELEKELERLIKADDENMILLYSRRCLEVIITDLCECELKRDRGTEPLKGIIDKLNKEKKIPPHITASMHGLIELSTYGAHPKDFEPEQVKPVLNNLCIIIKWYLKYKNFKVAVKGTPEQRNILEEVKKEERTEVQKKPARTSVRKLLISGIVTGILLVVAAIFVYPKIFKRDTLEDIRSRGKISVAVIPFQNMTNDTIWNVWQEGIKDILISFLSASEELNVRAPESVRGIIENEGLSDYASITPAAARLISRKLEADIYIRGNIQMAGSTIRLYAQLIDSKSAVVFKSFQTEGKNDEEKIFRLVDSLSVAIRDFLMVHELKRGHSHESQTNVYTYSPEAYRYFMQGENLFSDRDYAAAAKLFSQALAIDSNMIISILYMSLSYGNQGLYEQAKEWCLKAYQNREFMPVRLKLYSEWLYANYFETPREEITCLKNLIDVDDQAPMAFFILGNAYFSLQQYENAIQAYGTSLEIRNKWGMSGVWVLSYTNPGEAYHKTGKYREEKKIYKTARLAFPDDPALLYREAILSLSEGKTGEANKIIEKYISIQKARSFPESRILSYLAGIYYEAGISDKAEEYYRQALSLDPENPARMNGLAWALIDNGKDINEALELIEKAIELSPDNYSYLDTKGWGLHKQGKHKEALELLEKSWRLRPVYNHEVYLHLEAVKKAVAEHN